MSQSMPPGWYSGKDGVQNYWDGSAWTEGPSEPEPERPEGPEPPTASAQAPAPLPVPAAKVGALGRAEKIFVAISLSLVLLLVLFMWRPWRGNSTPSSVASVAPAAPRPVTLPTIRYELDGDGVDQADITYTTPSGTSQQQDIDVPMRSKSGGPGIEIRMATGAFVYFSAQIKSGSGSITCRIVNVDSGTVISENIATGDYAIATCKGRAE